MPSVRVEPVGAVAVVTLDRPPANVMDADSMHELADTFETLGTDDAVEAIVLTGEGRAFSAGLDLKSIVTLDAAGQEALITALNRAFFTVYACPRLVVAAVNGHAIAGGLVLALCCDVRVAADVPLTASLAEVRVGVVFPLNALEVVRHELAPSVVRRLVLTGETADAAKSVELGLFDRLVPAGDLRDTAVAAAESHPPPQGLARIKAQLRRPALDAMRTALADGDPLPRPWLTDETFAASAAALARR